MSDNTSNDLGAFLAGFVIGGLVGAATAIILAPQSGRETRAQIAAKGEQLVHSGEEQLIHYRDAASTYTHQYVDQANEVVAHTRQQVETATGRVQEQARIVLDRGKSPGNEADIQTPDESANDNGNVE
ncbi:MAG TPA: YtxH domain-containing protein [Chloroflexota bacterium]|nr:YtxH domain-containing protein [Chloroflexota bacterium]HUM71234.1 YtxH domain-containing protein [Chloroflexota bacterium]